jgi:hypothetical protein
MSSSALFRLHEEELIHAQIVNDTEQIIRSKHFLQTLTYKTVESLRVFDTGIPPDMVTLALWSHKIIYYTAMSHVRYGVRDKDWASDLERCKNYMRFLGEKLKIFGQYSSTLTAASTLISDRTIPEAGRGRGAAS